MVSAADAEGNVVVIVHSNSFPRFGSGIVVPGYDLTLANRAGRGFTPEAWSPELPGRRPPAGNDFARMGGRRRRTVDPRFMGATPGGANQMPWNAQTLARIARGRVESRGARRRHRSGSGCPRMTDCGSRQGSSPTTPSRSDAR